jgi:RNA polymerase sigma-70 factor, ECF subfamily
MSLDISLRSRATTVLDTAAPGDEITLDRLVPLIYDELRELAHRQLARERGDLTLQTTALVHEAYLKLADDTKVTRRGRAYFFAAAARTMRQVLVDRARHRKAAKRGGGAKIVTLGEEDASVDAYAAELLDLNDALERLGERSPRQVSVVEYRFFAGMSVEETAEVLGVSARTVESDWAMARAWLYQALGGAFGSPAVGGPG